MEMVISLQSSVDRGKASVCVTSTPCSSVAWENGILFIAEVTNFCSNHDYENPKIMDY